MRTRLIIAAVCGCVSGILSAWLPGEIGVNTLLWLPGAIFGGMFACYFLYATPSYRPSLKYLRWLFFIALSTAAYYAAVFVFLDLSNQYPVDKLKNCLLGILAGFVGSLILVLSIWLCSFRILSWRYAIGTILLGAVFGSLIEYESKLETYPLFVLWQTVVFLGLVSILPRELFHKSGGKIE